MKLLATNLLTYFAFASDIPSACERPCPMSIDPVCGSDGENYTNSCTFKNQQCLNKHLKKEKLILAYEGECVHSQENCQLGCPRNYDPVCVWDGKSEITFSNLCEFKVEVCTKKAKHLVVTRHTSCT